MYKPTALPMQLLPCAIMLVMALISFVADAPGPKPPAIRVRPQTVESMNREIAHDRLLQQYSEAQDAAARVYEAHGCDPQWAEATARAAVDYHVPSRLLSALVFVESSCNPDAVSKRGAIGLTQVNPQVWHYSSDDLHDPETNLRAGTRILASYIQQSGLREGLHRYNGLGDPSNTYSNRVLLVAGYRRQE